MFHVHVRFLNMLIHVPPSLSPPSLSPPTLSLLPPSLLPPSLSSLPLSSLPLSSHLLSPPSLSPPSLSPPTLSPPSLQVNWHDEIEEQLGKMRQEGLSPPQADTELVQQREDELK